MAAAAAPGLRGRIEHLLRVGPVSKPRVYAQVAASAEIVVRLAYRARRPLDDATRELLARTLSAALRVKELDLVLERGRTGARR